MIVDCFASHGRRREPTSPAQPHYSNFNSCEGSALITTLSNSMQFLYRLMAPANCSRDRRGSVGFAEDALLFLRSLVSTGTTSAAGQQIILSQNLLLTFCAFALRDSAFFFDLTSAVDDLSRHLPPHWYLRVGDADFSTAKLSGYLCIAASTFPHI